MDSQRTRIQNKLIALAKAGTFYAVTYDKATRQASVNTGTVIAPSTVLANEIRASFDTDENMRRRLARKRTDWRFSLILSFNQEVSLELFERVLLDNVPILPNDETNGFNAVFLEYEGLEVEHPVQQQPSSGTHATLTFNAIETRY